MKSASSFAMRSDIALAWTGSATDASVTQDLILSREAAAVLQMGVDVNGAAVAQTFKAHDGITGTDIAGANLILAGGRGTGSGAPGKFIVQSAQELATGTTAQTLATLLTISGGNNASVVSHFVYTAPTADLAMTASTESIGLSLGGTVTYTREWATGALALQRENYIQAPTYAFVGASTLTDAVTLAVSGPPIAGANATLTRSWIATFGTLEATTSTPTNGVGVFGAGRAEVVVRDATNNIEGVFHAGASVCGIGSATNHDIAFMTANTIRWSLTAATNGGLVASGNYRFSHGASALATTATEGYFHMNSCAGAPTGVPASIPTGQIPMVIDSTNSRIYAYIGGAWKSVAVA